MSRKLVAAYACRAGGTRLYGKPLQNLEPGYTILDHIIEGTKATTQIDEIVLGISEGTENQIFMEIARKHGIKYITGSEKDVLWRLIECGRASDATDIFRVTTECPFIAWELLADAWQAHVEHKNDITVTDYLPEGCNFEIYSQASLEQAHKEGEYKERSEYCSAYPRRRPDQFRIELIEPPQEWRRTDLRLTVDYPEDLILCRNTYTALKGAAPHIPIDQIINYVDMHPELKSLVESFVDTTPIWASALR